MDIEPVKVKHFTNLRMVNRRSQEFYLPCSCTMDEVVSKAQIVLQHFFKKMCELFQRWVSS